MTISRRPCPFDNVADPSGGADLERIERIREDLAVLAQNLANSIEAFRNFFVLRNQTEIVSSIPPTNILIQNGNSTSFNFDSFKTQLRQSINSPEVNQSLTRDFPGLNTAAQGLNRRLDILRKLQPYETFFNELKSIENQNQQQQTVECVSTLGRISITPGELTIAENSTRSEEISLFFQANPDSIELDLLNDVVVRVVLKNSDENSIISDFSFSESDINTYGIQKNINNGSFDFVIPYRIISNNSVEIKFRIVPISSYANAVNCATINIDAVSSGFGAEYSFFRIQRAQRQEEECPPGFRRENGECVEITQPQPRTLATSQTSYNYYDSVFENISINELMNETLLPNISAINSPELGNNGTLYKVANYRNFRTINNSFTINNYSVVVKDYFQEYNLELSKSLQQPNFATSFSEFQGITDFIYPSDYEKNILLENERKKLNFPWYVRIFYDRNGEQPTTYLNTQENNSISLLSNSLLTQQFNKFLKQQGILDYFYYALIKEVYNKTQQETDSFLIHKQRSGPRELTFLQKYFDGSAQIDLGLGTANNRATNKIVYYGLQNKISDYNVQNPVKRLFYQIIQQRPELFVNQTLMYQVVKKRGDTIVQRFYFINIFENSFLDFIDTQLKYGLEYTYEIYLYSFKVEQVTDRAISDLQTQVNSKTNDLNNLRQRLIASLNIFLEYGDRTKKPLNLVNKFRNIVTLQAINEVDLIKNEIINSTETESDLERLRELMELFQIPISSDRDLRTQTQLNTAISRIISDIPQFLLTKEQISNILRGIDTLRRTGVFPTVRLNRQLVDTVKTTILDSLPTIPNVNFIPYAGRDREILIRLNADSNQYEDYLPEIILDQDEIEISRNRRINTSNNKTKYKSDDSVSQFEIFRLEEEPKSFQDFKNAKITLVSTLLNGVYYKSVSFIDNIMPNKKYYYIIRTRDVHGSFSNPTKPIEIEMINENGTIFLRKKQFIFKSIEMKESKSIKKYLEIKPSLQQCFLSTPEQNQLGGTITSAEDIKNDINLGNSNLTKIWGKQYVLKVISKKTGKKIDIKFKFNHSRI